MLAEVDSDLVPMRSDLHDEPSPMRVLVVEDDPFTLTILKKRLLKEGHEIATAINGREGLEKVDSFRPDLILSDWMMPEMDGYQFCQEIRKRPDGQNLYFILLTAKDKNEDKVSALDTGADEYLVKPCDGRELMARLRAAHRLLKLQKDLAQSNLKLEQAYRRINDEIQAASLIQRSLLPQQLLVVPGYRFSAHYQPSTACSGDFYDMVMLEDGRLGLVIGDVSGHGTPAMVAMALIHALFHVTSLEARNPASLLFAINNSMFEHLPTPQYATMFYSLLNPLTGELAFSSAGHNPPLLFDPKAGRCEYLEGCEGFPIKLIAPDMPYDDHSTRLEPGQALILYTDGLTEAFDPEDRQFGNEGLKEAVSRAGVTNPTNLQAAILDSLDLFRQKRPIQDDLSLLIVERTAD